MNAKKLTAAEILAAARAAEANKPSPGRPRLSVEEQKRLAAAEQFEEAAQVAFRRFEVCSYEQLSEEERDCINLWWLCAEVNSGGFHTFFYNDSGNHVQDTQRALERIEARETSRILSDAIALYFPEEPPSQDADERFRQIQRESVEQEPEAESLNDSFYECAEDIKRLYLEFWRQQKAP